MKAIQTQYGGYKFRSRLEARWAVVMDALGIQFEYEREGYELKSGKYLPDFWLPKHNKWLEIKGQNPNYLEDKLAYELADATSHPVLMLFGDIPSGRGFDTDSAYIYHPGDGWDCGYRLCECPTCGFAGFEFDGRSDRLECKDKCPRSSHGDKGYTYDSPRILAAYRRARAARFEHGETPSRAYLNIVNYDQIAF